MKHGILAATLAMSLVLPVVSASAQTRSANSSLGTITLAHKVTAGGQPLTAGTYEVRLSADEPKAVVGQSADGTRYVEFVKGGKVVAKELATVVSNADAPSVAKGPWPSKGGSRVDMLKGNNYVRVWINRAGTNYLIHLPPVA